MSKLRRLKFIIWRWFFVRFRLRGLIAAARHNLEAEYKAYRNQPLGSDQKYMSFVDWCGENGNE